MPEVEAKTAESFVVMAKPVGSLCNMQCEYCYYLGTEYSPETAQKSRMSDEMLERFVKDYISSSPGPVVAFTWHGGEPTIAGLDFYRKAVELQKKYLPEGWEVWNNLQTNGLLLDDEWCEFLAKNRFDVGLSVDGTSWLHDRFRKDHMKQGTYSRVSAAAERLKAHGVMPDLLCTVTSETVKEPVAVYRALKSLGTGWIQFIPIVRRTPDGGITEDSVNGEGYGELLCRVFDDWLIHDLGKTTVQLFAETARVYNGGTPNLCWMAPTCGRVLIVEKDGGVYSCDHFVTPEHRIGSLEESSLSELVELPVQKSFGMAKRDVLPSSCRNCQYLPACGGGCIKDRFIEDENGEGGLNWLCSGLKRFFEHSKVPLERMVELNRNGKKAEEIRMEFFAAEQKRWKGVGRNDPCPCGSGKKAKNCCWDRRP